MKRFIEATNEGMKDLVGIAGVNADNLNSREIKKKKQELERKGYKFETIGPPYGVHLLQRFSFQKEFVAGNYITLDPLTNDVSRTLIQTKDEWDAIVREIKKGGIMR